MQSLGDDHPGDDAASWWCYRSTPRGRAVGFKLGSPELRHLEPAGNGVLDYLKLASLRPAIATSGYALFSTDRRERSILEVVHGVAAKSVSGRHGDHERQYRTSSMSSSSRRTASRVVEHPEVPGARRVQVPRQEDVRHMEGCRQQRPEGQGLPNPTSLWLIDNPSCLHNPSCLRRAEMLCTMSPILKLEALTTRSASGSPEANAAANAHHAIKQTRPT